MGENLKGNFEDLELQQKSPDRIREIAQRRNEEFDIWGWKDPYVVGIVDRIHSDLRNPHFVCVLRDPFAVTLTEGRRTGNENSRRKRRFQKQIMERTIDTNKTIVDFIFSHDYPYKFFSFEKVLRDQERWIRELADFCKVELDEETKQEAMDFIRPRHYG